MSNLTFSGNKDTDYEILYNLSDYDLGNVCQTNRYTRDLCKNDVFWMNRTLKRFSPVFKFSFNENKNESEAINENNEIEVIKKYKEEHAKTWREYYIDLVDSMEKYYVNGAKNEVREREDYNIIVKYIQKNTKKYRDSCNNLECSTNWLNEDFIDLDDMFYFIVRNDVKNKYDLLIKILQVPSFNITGLNIELFLEKYNLYRNTGLIKLLTYKNSLKVRSEIMNLILEYSDFNEIIDALITLNPYIENADEILNVLFEKIKEGYGIEKKIIVLFLDEAIKKGSSLMDIEKYYELSKGVGNQLDVPEEESYIDSMKVVKKYLKNNKNKIDKVDKLSLIYEKLQKNKYSDKVYDKILKLL